jgi:hypothetical protein
VPQIAVKISDGIYAKLKRLAHQGQTNYATIIEAALSVYEPGASEASESSEEIKTLIDAALQPVLERLATLEKMGIVKHQHLSGVTVHVTPQNAPELALDAQPLPEGADNQGTPGIAVSAAVDVIEREAVEAFSSILPEKEPRQGKKSVKEFIASLVQGGERSPSAIARALNQAGYRTQAGSEFKRSNPQIAAALKAKD